MEDPRPVVYALLAILSLVVFRTSFVRSKIDGVPIFGSAGILNYYRDAARFVLHGDNIVKDGYARHRGSVFRVPFLRRWNFLASGPALISDMCYTPEDVLSFDEAVREQMQSDLTMGPELRASTYHIPAVLSNLTRNLGKRFPDVRDELVCAFDDVLAIDGTDWKRIEVVPAFTDVVTRISNRLFVGLPLCRNPEYVKFTEKHTVDVVFRGQLIGLLPNFLRPILGPLISSRHRNMRTAMRLLGPMVKERLQIYAAHAEAGEVEWADKPNDLISWLLDNSGLHPEHATVYAIVQRILVVLMAALHTSSLTFADAILDLAEHPEYLAPLRDEVSAVIAKHGWTKAALGEMHKIDSFLRESQRLNGLGCLSTFRKVVHPDGFTFADGTFLPSGSFINIPVRAVHLDPDNFPEPHKFDPFRFSDERAAQANPNGADESKKTQPQVFRAYMVTTTPTHLPFGHGRHACPGRFFAATELKAMLAEVVLNYDVKLEERPDAQMFDQFRSPDPKATVWMRKRSSA